MLVSLLGYWQPDEQGGHVVFTTPGGTIVGTATLSAEGFLYGVTDNMSQALAGEPLLGGDLPWYPVYDVPREVAVLARTIAEQNVTVP